MAARSLRDELLERAHELVRRWEEGFGPFAAHPADAVDRERLERAWQVFSGRMAGNFPFFHPRFAGQMLKPPHPVAAAGYLAAMLVNPNNHALDGGPVTSEMEKEVIATLGRMFRLPEVLGHLTSSGTLANLEALFVARELAPDKQVVYGSNAHYTHERMCRLLRLEAIEVGVDTAGRLDLEAVDRLCAGGRVGTVVLTAGSTGRGRVDEIHEALRLKERYGVRLHVDAAYGGFFSVLAWDEQTAGLVPADSLKAISQCDSVVVDPHKHGLQPYGCGAVLFSDPGVGALYHHDSPYTYFTSEALHLGEISLECSRAGAAAAGLWLTLETVPLEATEGFGPILSAGRRAALRLAGLLERDDGFALLEEPELDIVTYLPYEEGLSRAEAGSWSQRMLRSAMGAPDPVWLSTLQLEAEEAAGLAGFVVGDGGLRVLRSVLMKPAHELYLEELLARLVEIREETRPTGGGPPPAP
ncbi:MAG: aminotransferase class I/II-fold pyridoxal phosphate-dependent enzyme [Actinomycetota bacterium]|nr:aminotransferase class I/II-fold pyridoxal phosphate-dependent enzyme [Actinomycetota bacterium]